MPKGERGREGGASIGCVYISTTVWLFHFLLLRLSSSFPPILYQYLFVGATPESLGGVNEWLWDPVGGDNDVIKYVKDGKTARLFVWKLHNAVSSSISRGEAWYHAVSVRRFILRAVIKLV